MNFAFLLSTDPLALRLRWLDGKDSLAAKTLRACLWQFRSEWRRQFAKRQQKRASPPRSRLCHRASCRRGPPHVGQSESRVVPRFVGHVRALGLLGIVDEPAARPIIMQQIEKPDGWCCGRSLPVCRGLATDEHPSTILMRAKCSVCDIVMLLPAGFDRARP